MDEDQIVDDVLNAVHDAERIEDLEENESFQHFAGNMAGNPKDADVVATQTMEDGLKEFRQHAYDDQYWIEKNAMKEDQEASTTSSPQSKSKLSAFIQNVEDVTVSSPLSSSPMAAAVSGSPKTIVKSSEPLVEPVASAVGVKNLISEFTPMPSKVLRQVTSLSSSSDDNGEEEEGDASPKATTTTTTSGGSHVKSMLEKWSSPQQDTTTDAPKDFPEDAKVVTTSVKSLMSAFSSEKQRDESPSRSAAVEDTKVVTTSVKSLMSAFSSEKQRDESPSRSTAVEDTKVVTTSVKEMTSKFSGSGVSSSPLIDEGKKRAKSLETSVSPKKVATDTVTSSSGMVDTESLGKVKDMTAAFSSSKRDESPSRATQKDTSVISTSVKNMTSVFSGGSPTKSETQKFDVKSDTAVISTSVKDVKNLFSGKSTATPATVDAIIDEVKKIDVDEATTRTKVKVEEEEEQPKPMSIKDRMTAFLNVASSSSSSSPSSTKPTSSSSADSNAEILPAIGTVKKMTNRFASPSKATTDQEVDSQDDKATETRGRSEILPAVGTVKAMTDRFSSPSRKEVIQASSSLEAAAVTVAVAAEAAEEEQVEATKELEEEVKDLIVETMPSGEDVEEAAKKVQHAFREHLGRETEAAKLIQTSFRNHKKSADEEEGKDLIVETMPSGEDVEEAAKKVQHVFREHLERVKSSGNVMVEEEEEEKGKTYVKANEASGSVTDKIVAEDEGIQMFEDLKIYKKYRYLIYEIQGNNIKCVEQGDRDATLKQFMSRLADNQCRYCVIDHEFDKSDQYGTRKMNKLWFISWTPVTATTHLKVLYTSERASLLGRIQGVYDIICSSRDDILGKLGENLEDEDVEEGDSWMDN